MSWPMTRSPRTSGESVVALTIGGWEYGRCDGKKGIGGGREARKFYTQHELERISYHRLPRTHCSILLDNLGLVPGNQTLHFQCRNLDLAAMMDTNRDLKLQEAQAMSQ